MTSNTQKAIQAANRLQYQGEMTDPPAGISVMRWRAMIDQIIRNGQPLQFRDCPACGRGPVYDINSHWEKYHA